MQTQNDYVEILKDHLSERCKRNKGYSLRAFARDIDISPQRLSHILNGRHGLSSKSALIIAKNLGLDEIETTFFCTLVEQKHARSKLVKEEASKKLNEMKSFYKDLSIDHFKIIADWYHFAIMELSLTESFRSNYKWIAKALGITEVEVKMAIERLLRLELIQVSKQGEISITGNFFADPKGTPSEALRQFHKQLMQKAQEAVSIQAIEKRDYSSTIMAINESDIPNAKIELRKFREKFDKQFSSTTKKTHVFCLGIQFFSLQNNVVTKESV
jgi:uncharacterized protein (TIGR02147 family)